MTKPLKFLANLKMTNAIAAMVLCSIVLSIGSVSVSIYKNLHELSVRESIIQQDTNIGVAATILERQLSLSDLVWSEDGKIASFTGFNLPPFLDNGVIDSITRITKQDATVYGYDESSAEFRAMTTSLVKDTGGRATDMTIAAADGPYEALLAGSPFVGEVVLEGTQYLGSYQPIAKATGGILGAIFVGVPLRTVDQAASSILGPISTVGAVVTVIIGAIGLVLSRLITRPIPRLAHAMQEIADGNYDTSVPYTSAGNEVGAMARAIEIARSNGQKISAMTEAEATRSVQEQANRRGMMEELQASFGVVVDAAIAGDFTKTVSTDFPDPEINGLAESVNNLVATFNRAVSDIGQVLGAMANTDLTTRMNGNYEGAFAKLKLDINAVADRLSEVISKLRTTSRGLKSATGEILAGANDLSQRTSRQATSIMETSAAMEKLAVRVSKNAERAKSASANAIAVTKTAEEGGQVMDAANAAMDRITQSSGRISNIIGMIDDIAFQTNLLALNASVEAARAGDAGKGFAVVAVEVRRLAQSAAGASAEVKQLIEMSAEEVGSGSKLVGQAAGKLEGMLKSARENSALLESMAKESLDQVSAIKEVNQAVRAMDEMTQDNAALVEETNAAIEQTEARAGELDRIVDTFVIVRPVGQSSPRPKLRVS